MVLPASKLAVNDRDAVLDFWFPAGAGVDLAIHRQYWEWRMRGGAHTAIVQRFSEITEHAACGELEAWARTPRGRLALVVVLDQFSRSVWADSPRAFAQDAKAVALVLEGIANGNYDALETAWEKTFYIIPLGHCEGPGHLERLDLAIELARAVLDAAPAHLKPMYQFNAEQPVLHRQVIAAFGRHPHRNRVLGRESSAAELAYLERGEFPHQREIRFS
jgi:uncharacterized protein (DUF924 family)